VAVLAVAAITGLIFPLKQISTPESNGVLYLLAVLLVATVWGFRLGLVTTLLSAAAFNYFHLPPTGRFTIADSRHWVALVIFLVAAVVASAVAELARSRAVEAEQRSRTSVTTGSWSPPRAPAARSTAKTSLGCSSMPPGNS
jgi:two-component system sensor histidine kinase KdpD